MPDKSLIIKEAQKYLARGQIDKAIAEWEKLVKEAPDGNTYNTIGDLYLKKGDKKTAIDCFHKAATFFREGGFSLKALALYKKVININPADANAYAALGELSEEKGLVTDAIKYFLTAADILSKETNKERFLNIYERILSLAPSNIALRDKVAGLFLKEGFASHAIREYLHIARQTAEKGETEQARIYYAKILNLQPDNRNALVDLSHLDEKKGDLRSAIEYMKRAVEIQRDDSHLLLRYAGLLKEASEYDEALSVAARIIEINPSNVDANRITGDIHLFMNEREKAWESYKVVVDSLIQEGEAEKASEIARQFKDVNPVEIGKLLISLYKQKNDIDAAFEETLFVADILLDSGLKEEAVELYRNALTLRPGDMEVKRILAEQEMALGMEPSDAEKEKSTSDLLTDADIFIKYGLHDEAMTILEELKMKEPDNVDIHTRLKSLYMEMNDKELAVTECLILYELYGRSGNAEMSDMVLQEAEKISPEDPRVLERLAAKTKVSSGETLSYNLDDYAEELAEAEFYVRQDLKDDALRIYHKLLAAFPDNTEILAKISSLEGGLFVSRDGGREIRETEEFPTTEPETIDADIMHEVVEPQFDADVLDIFEEFKKGLEKELEVEDSETHYNLGIAYKEMGLIDDAIKEFQTSRNDPECSVRSLTMLGICYMEKGLYPLAIEAFKGALENIGTRDESYWGALYDLASAYDKNGNVKEAFTLYSDVYGWNSKFRQVAERLNHTKALLAKEDTSGQQKERKSRVSYI